MTPREFLQTLAPDFCFCSLNDLFLMYEQIDEDKCFFVFQQEFQKFKHLFETKKNPYSPRWNALLYRRIT